MKYFLFNPPTGLYDRADRCQAPIEEEGIRMVRPPMDLAYMAAMVKKVGQIAVIKDYPSEGKNFDDFLSDLNDIKPDVLILSATTPTLDLDLKSCSLAKEFDRNILTIAKGGDFYLSDKEVLTKFEDLDIVVCGESEEVIYEIAKGRDLKEVKGIIYRKGREIIKNSARPLLKNLDNLPFPARELLKKELYCFPDTGLPYALIIAGRGCPGNCIFCLVGKVSGKKLRARSVKNVVDEVEYCVQDLGISTFFFRADTFTWDKEWVIHFCQEIQKRKLKIRWGTNSRVDTIDEEMIKLMKTAGCDIIGFGIESGNQEILNKIKKGITLGKSKTAVELCHHFKIKTLLFFVLGFPWDDKKTIGDTIKFAKRLPGTFYNFSFAYPFPGTELEKFAKKYKLFVQQSLLGYDYAKPALKTLFLSDKLLIYYKKKALRKILFSPNYIWRVISQINSPKEFFNYFHNAWLNIRKLVLV